MLYLCIILVFVIAVLSACLFYWRRAIRLTIHQMEEIEIHPERNRLLKTYTVDGEIEKLLQHINQVYQARQQERIVYQRSETQIRREIENISHDLRTPLTSIIGYLDLLQDEGTTAEERTEYLTIIQKRAKVLQSFIQDFYEISRIEGDDYPILLDVITVQNMVKETAVAYYHEFEQKHINVTVSLEDNPSYVIGDKIQLNRILNNLIQNALKYATKEFQIKQFTEEGYCVLQFMNDKNNMTQEELAVIFDRFYTGDQSRSNQSTGLGLTITKLLVEKMKGTIKAKFEGTMFVIELRWIAQ